MKLIRLTAILALSVCAAVRAEEKQYRNYLAEPVPVFPMPLGKTEGVLTPVMREAWKCTQTSLKLTHCQTRRDAWELPDNHLYSEEKSLHDFWIKGQILSPEEAAFTYACLGLAASDKVMTANRLRKRLENPEMSHNSFSVGSGYAYMLTLACDPLKVRYSREPKAQAAEMRLVTDAALAAAVLRHKTLLAAREPDYEKKYPPVKTADIVATFPPRDPKMPPGQLYTEEQFLILRHAREVRDAMSERGRMVEELYVKECQEMARIFLQWIPGDRDRIRRLLIECGYPTPESRAVFWKNASKTLYPFFNETHLDLLRDLKNP